MKKSMLIVLACLLVLACALTGCKTAEEKAAVQEKIANTTGAAAAAALEAGNSGEEAEKSFEEYLNVDWIDGFIELSTGIQMAFVECGPEDGTPIILLHGVTDGRVSWAQVAPKLAEMGYHVYCPEYRGNGKTDKPEADENGYTADIIADDIIAFMDQLGIEKAHVGGHSYGSLISQMINLKAPERLLSTILIDTTVDAGTSEVLEWAENGDGEEYLGVKGYDEEGAMPDSFLVSWAENSNPDESFQAATIAHLRQMPYECWYKLIHACRSFNNTEHIGEVSGKVLVIWGTEDSIFPAADQEAVKAGLTGADVTYVDIPGSHNIHWDSLENAAAVAEAIDTFIKGL